ncbi:hypothetical protein [Aurantiacibacter marinus]|uniref:DUF1493 family protein n=1 Tax=Aurantiacibacter marinus TaxID=874156 RepID=A0A0H0XTM6_9SPHN|nr:hypothetical protein [Aurantiacibacter marinus]KLI63665.1 hypothetical protein AAV99_07980 [Aurantiacibacter marinus]
MIDPPPKSDGALAYVLWVAREWQGCTNATELSAVMQDLGIGGEDVDDFALRLAERYGDQVADWPWQRFADLNEGLSLLFPFMLVWQLASWPFRGRFSYPSNKQRLTLGHIAFVLERGEWVDP